MHYMFSLYLYWFHCTSIFQYFIQFSLQQLYLIQCFQCVMFQCLKTLSATAVGVVYTLESETRLKLNCIPCTLNCILLISKWGLTVYFYTKKRLNCILLQKNFLTCILLVSKWGLTVYLIIIILNCIPLTVYFWPQNEA